MGDWSYTNSMASVWQFASTTGLIFLLAVQSNDPEELQVLDTFLATQLVSGVSNVDDLRHTGGSLQVTP